MNKLATLLFVSALVSLSAVQASAMVPGETVHVPDAASTAMLFGAGVVGLFSVRRFLAKR